MSGVNPGVQPGQAGQVGQNTGVDGRVKPQGKADESDTDAFKDAMNANKKEAEKSKPLTPEEELRKAMTEGSMRQFMERSKELAQETKKNFE
ncbi:hypothetical protein M3P05_11445 [Sansalvadorimonas sp. 2012CJ34-2]|uniref:Uncharacterized protein n=1 Tax=Parendozoicomonas callyspongiae TaxID=2942213 RepID=A0ABT0PGM7_9GAMM|nr:hypothetical protein [Sansalvadorimonas sp. 2012CJ34-2]MCL6270537.1 hypothetical protein [Sansalvadorimonas sp. 2012CJ34-2]